MQCQSCDASTQQAYHRLHKYTHTRAHVPATRAWTHHTHTGTHVALCDWHMPAAASYGFTSTSAIHRREGSQIKTKGCLLFCVRHNPVLILVMLYADAIVHLRKLNLDSERNCFPETIFTLTTGGWVYRGGILLGVTVGFKFDCSHLYGVYI